MSQVLLLPADNCQLEAGYKNSNYKKYYGYHHYGHDYGHPLRNKFNVLASGEGIVMACGKDNASMGYVAAIIYKDVTMPGAYKDRDLTIRYFHMESLKVHKGQKVRQGDVIGVVGNTVSGMKHVHVEIDLDTKYPTYSPQVAGGPIIKKGTDSTINPSTVFYIGPNQKYTLHTVATYYNKISDNIVRKRSAIANVVDSTKVQKLILPINKCRVTASKGMVSYKKKYGFDHYGTDMISTVGDTTVYASGNGVCLAAGMDTLFGNTVIVKYQNVYNHTTKKTCDIILRYFHGAKILIKEGDTVTKDTAIMHYGSTGKYVSGAHLHITADTDTEYFAYEPGIAQNGNIIKKGNSSTVINPMEVFHKKVSSPDCQTIDAADDIYVLESDIEIPPII